MFERIASAVYQVLLFMEKYEIVDAALADEGLQHYLLQKFYKPNASWRYLVSSERLQSCV